METKYRVLAACAAIVSCLILIGKANAVPVTLQFNDLGLPLGTISGSIGYNQSPVDQTIISLISIDLTIVDPTTGSHTFTLAQTAFQNNFPSAGLINIEGTDPVSISQFTLNYSLPSGSPAAFSYIVNFQAGCLTCLGSTRNVEINISETPLPAALPLFASGAGVLGYFGWRRKRKALAA